MTTLQIDKVYPLANGQSARITDHTPHNGFYHGEVIREEGFKPFPSAWLIDGRNAFNDASLNIIFGKANDRQTN